MFKIYQNNQLKIVTDQWTENDAKFIKDVEVVEDAEHQVSDYLCIGEYYALTDSAEAIQYQMNEVRSLRNQYLVDYVDGVVSNPLRWADLKLQEQANYKNYRRYLLDFTEVEKWWKNKPKTFEEWLSE